MAKLIDADKANIKDIYCGYGCTTDLYQVKDWFEALPAVDAVEVVHGLWVKLGKHDWACSACKRGVPYSHTGYHYCPNCGAKMDLPQITEQTENALYKMGEKAHGDRK